MKRIIFTKEAIKTLRRVPANAAGTIRAKIDQLAGDPASLANNVVRLQGRPAYRLRVGDWRVIFAENKDTLEVLAVRPRGGAYKE